MSIGSKILIFSILIILTTIAYLPAFNAGFVYDDQILIQGNPSIRDLKKIPLFFTSKDARVPREFSRLQDDIYRPLQSISYAVSYFLWGLDAGLFHAENVILHIINGLLVWFLVSLLFESTLLAFFSSLLFLIHPVQVEAVTYLAGRADVLFLFFLLLSFLAFIRKRYVLSPVLFSASLLSKEMAITLPFIIIVYLIFFRPDKEKNFGLEVLKKTWPYFLIMAIFFLVRTLNLGRIAQEGSRDLLFLFLVAGRVFAEYLKLIFLPIGLTLYPELNAETPGISPLYLGCIVVTGVFLYLCALAARRNKPVAFLLFSYLAALFPVSNIIPIKTRIQERFMYFPSIFIMTAVSFAAVRLWGWIDRRGYNLSKAVYSSLAAIIVAALMVAAFDRNLDWKDRKTMMEREMVLHPESGIPYVDIGALYFREKDYDMAKTYLEKAVTKERIYPLQKTMAYNLLGDIYRKRDDPDAAIRHYLKALAITPAYAHSLNSLGDLYFRRGEYEKAKDSFLKAVEVWPDSAMFNSNLGTVYSLLGDKKNALKYWKRSLEINPNQPQIGEYIAENE